VEGRFAEEERSKQNSIFSVIRSLTNLFATDTETDPQLGLYGAFGYDLTFQFESVKLKHERSETDGERDLVMYLPDEILVHDVQAARAWRLKYEFEMDGKSTSSIGRNEKNFPEEPFVLQTKRETTRDHKRGEYARSVENARKEFKCGNLFECVLSQTFRERCPSPPSTVYSHLVQNNPSPYLFILNLGRKEHLVGASPEMFVRVEKTPLGTRVETCPISGTIRRGADALQDADRVFEILDSAKDKSELTMCTDVDRNDKSRVCKPGSVQVVGRRQIEKYSKLIHTVDHVEGYLRDGFDALDAFLVHTWAVTVSGAPKTWAIQFIEQNERSARCWYGGAVGILGFDGHLNTGLTIRTVRIRDGVAEVRAGATLLWDSIPEEEEKETELKASAFLEAVVGSQPTSSTSQNGSTANMSAEEIESIRFSTTCGIGKRIVLVDHEDSFVHTLANYLRQTGAEVKTIRHDQLKAQFEEEGKPDLVVLSPGPGRPEDFKCSATLEILRKERIPVFGVCLGLQAMIEYFGGELGVLSYPMHGKPSDVNVIRVEGDYSFAGIDDVFPVARYHSLYATRMPDELTVTATALAKGDSGEDICMAIKHKTLPFAAVQFHPESILTRHHQGLRLLANAVAYLKY
jgi:anthranilate synthase